MEIILAKKLLYLFDTTHIYDLTQLSLYVIIQG